jgi:hypothetical protein
MRIAKTALVAGLLATTTAAGAGYAHAEDIDAATLGRISAAASAGYARPDAATVRGVRKSRAVNGSGYCGEITIEVAGGTTAGGESASFTVFHVLLETPTGPSVLRLSDFPGPEASPQAATVHQMMRNFGCVR